MQFVTFEFMEEANLVQEKTYPVALVLLTLPDL